MQYNSDTIAALATPVGTSGIAVIRVSGDDAVVICDKIFSGDLNKAASHTVHLGKVKDDSGRIIDQVLMTIMRAPGSYTGENTVEISCHGSMTVVREIMKLLFFAGARQAKAGEFTKRAFLNGKLDLVQAEAVIDIINSKNETALDVGINHLEGGLSEKINSAREKLLRIMAYLQAEADFPEEGVSGFSDELFRENIKNVICELSRLLETAKAGKYIREGISTVLAGKPNAGKSSLLNRLLERERAIVTDIEGTTRDTVEEYLQLGKITLKLIDTAGIRKTDNTVEKIGVDIAVKAVSDADLVLYIADMSDTPNEDDIKIIERIKDKKVIMVLNKSDIKSESDEYSKLMDCRKIMISAKTGEGIEELKKAVEEMFGDIGIENSITMANIRHIEAVAKAKKILEEAYEAYASGIPADCISVDIQSALESLGEITGMTVSEEIVDKIFKEFCVGK